jgi:hypothetical protein
LILTAAIVTVSASCNRMLSGVESFAFPQPMVSGFD